MGNFVESYLRVCWNYLRSPGPRAVAVWGFLGLGSSEFTELRILRVTGFRWETLNPKPLNP